jgi:hypothetical protein
MNEQKYAFDELEGISYDRMSDALKNIKGRNKRKTMAKGAIKPASSALREKHPGWIVPLLAQAVKTGRVLVPMSNCRITTTDGPLTLNYPGGMPGLESIIASCKNVDQGSSIKAWAKGEAPAVPGVVNVDLLTNQCCAYVIKISDPVNYARHGEIDFALTFDFGGPTARTFNFGVTGQDNIYEAFILAFTNNGGKGEVGRSEALRFSINTTGQPVNDGLLAAPPTAFTVESINEYDFNTRNK